MLFYTLNLDEVQKNKFEQIYEKYRKLMFHLAYEMLEDEMESEDVVHIASIKMLRYLDNIDLEKPTKTKIFIITIVRNICIDMLRKRP